jgi:hypothetical protein
MFSCRLCGHLGITLRHTSTLLASSLRVDRGIHTVLAVIPSETDRSLGFFNGVSGFSEVLQATPVSEERMAGYFRDCVYRNRARDGRTCVLWTSGVFSEPRRFRSTCCKIRCKVEATTLSSVAVIKLTWRILRSTARGQSNNPDIRKSF